MHDRLWFTVTETLLALAMFRDEFDTTFVVLFISLIFVKCFHWLAADRVEWVSLTFEKNHHAQDFLTLTPCSHTNTQMDQSPTPPGRLFHARMISVLSIIWVTDLLLIAYATESVLLEGPSVILMFEMEVNTHLTWSVVTLARFERRLMADVNQFFTWVVHHHVCDLSLHHLQIYPQLLWPTSSPGTLGGEIDLCLLH